MSFAPRKLTLGVGVIAAATLVLSGCSGDAGNEGSSTVNVSLPNHTWTTAIQERIGEFEKESGITVKVNTFGEDQLSDQYNVKLNAGSSDFDVLMFRPLQEGRQFVQNKWLKEAPESLLTDKDWNWDDFQQGPRDAVTINDKVYGVPLVTEREIVYYRTDLLEAAGIEVPTTTEEFAAAVEALHDPDNGVFGFVARGAMAAAVTQFSSYLFSFGGDFNTGDKATVDTPEAIEAYEYYSGLLNKYGPPGTTNMSWPEALAIFAQGKAAFYTDADSLYNNMDDPSVSSVIGKVGFAAFPAGPAGSKPYNIPSWAAGVNEFSKNQDNAWKFIQWATSEKLTLDIQASGVPSARDSAWDNPAGTAGFPEQLVEVIQVSAKNGVGHDRPLVTQVGKARDIVGAPIVEGIEGRDVVGPAKKAQTNYQEFLDKEK